MKKILGYILIAGFGALITLVVTGTFNNDKEAVHITETPVYPEKPVPAQPANYIPGPAVNGPDFRTAAEMSVNAVVHIRTTFERKSSVYDDFFGQLREYFNQPRSHPYVPLTAYGSGVIISNDGYVVTNNHVVQDASEIEVTMNDKRAFKARIIGNDPSTDLALIKIEAEDLPHLNYGNSDKVMVGEWVLAVGNPFNLTSTVTAGIVSAKARDINILGSNSAIESFIQTDAAVNKGNSGGALVNTQGELIGINAAIASNTGFYEGYSFAIPVNIVKKVVADFMEFGAIQRAFIGVVIREMDADLAKEKGMDEIKGVCVVEISEGSGASEAGIREGDIITTVNGSQVNTVSSLLEIIGQHRPGNKVLVSIIRDGRKKEFSVLLRNANGTVELAKKEEAFSHQFLGAKLRSINANEVNRFGISGGLIILELDENGMLDKGGVRKGFIIKRLNNIQVDSRTDIETALRENNSALKVEGIYPNGMEFVYVFEL